MQEIDEIAFGFILTLVLVIVTGFVGKVEPIVVLFSRRPQIARLSAYKFMQLERALDIVLTAKSPE
jgi:hypothetical protein